MTWSMKRESDESGRCKSVLERARACESVQESSSSHAQKRRAVGASTTPPLLS